MEVFLFIGFVAFLIATTVKPPAPPSPDSCSDQLVLFFPCLPYVSSFPNNMTDSPPPQCCDEITSAVASGNAICLCYFIQRPRILGFPVNYNRVVSLASVCPTRNVGGTANFSVKSLCSGKTVLPPLKSITGQGSSSPHLSGQDKPPPPQMSPPKESENRSSRLPPVDDSSIDPDDDDSSIEPAADDSSIKPANDDPSVEIAVESPTITVTITTSACTTGKIRITCLSISLGIAIFLADIFI